MNIAAVSKTDFIKFNVSPTFKALAIKKAKEHGMTVPELGRMLFGSLITDISHSANSETSKKFLTLAEEAKKNYRRRKGKTFNNSDEMVEYLNSLK